MKQGHKKRHDQAQKLWEQWMKLNDTGVPVSVLAKRYISPYTGDRYTQNYIWVKIRQMRRQKNVL